MNSGLRIAILFLILLVQVRTTAAQWMPIGDWLPEGFAHQVAVAPDGTVYAAQRSPSSELLAFRLGARGWESIGQVPLSKSSYWNFVMKTDGNGNLYIGGDSARYAVLFRYDGSGWQMVGKALKFDGVPVILELRLAFDAADRPCIGASGMRSIFRYDGSGWMLIGRTDSVGQFHWLASDRSGQLYGIRDDTIVVRYVADTTWDVLDNSGIPWISDSYGTNAVLAASPTGELHITQTSIRQSRNEISVVRHDGERWSMLGVPINEGRVGSWLMFGTNGAPYIITKGKAPRNGFRLHYFNGSAWTDVDTLGLPPDAANVIWSVSDRQGNIYVGIHEDTVFKNLRIYKYNTRNDPLSVSRNAGPAELSIYPVPAGHAVTVRCAAPAMYGMPATITDIQGRIIHDFRLAASGEIETGSWVPGIYNLNLPDGRALKFVKE